jgi:hypothetical protein
MYDYNTRLFARYNRLVVSLAVLADERANWRPARFGYSLWGCKVNFEYPVAKLLDFAGQEAALEANPNPFAVVVLAHLKALQTTRNPTARHSWKVRLVRGLYERGLSAEDVRGLFRFIDWVLELPAGLEASFWEEVEEIEEERSMPYVTSVERRALERGRAEGRDETRREGLLDAIELGLDLKFGKKGLQLMSRMRKVNDLNVLQAVRGIIRTATDLVEIKQLLP